MTITLWSADLNDPQNLSAIRTDYNERSNGTISVSGSLFGESPALTYTGSLSSVSTSIIYLGRENSNSPWKVENYVGTAIYSGNFFSEPFSFTLTATLTFNEEFYQTIGDYRYIVDALFTDAVLTITENPVPEPATMMLFSLGLLGVAGVSRKKN